MRHRIGLVVISAMLAVPAIARPQAMNGPAKVLAIFRETVKPGKDLAHNKWEFGWSRAGEAATKTPTISVAMTAMTGPNEAWYIRGFGSFAEMQKDNERNDANPAAVAVQEKYVPGESEYLQDGRLMILTLREDLSYSTGRPLSELRFMSVTRILVRPGHTAEFVEARTAVKAAHEKAKLPDAFAIYQVANGMPGGTFYLFAGRKTLAEVDDAAKVHADPAYVAALGADWAKQNATLVQAYETSADANLFAMAPGMSTVPKEWIASDPFWKPKASPKKAP